MLSLLVDLQVLRIPNVKLTSIEQDFTNVLSRVSEKIGKHFGIAKPHQFKELLKAVETKLKDEASAKSFIETDQSRFMKSAAADLADNSFTTVPSVTFKLIWFLKRHGADDERFKPASTAGKALFCLALLLCVPLRTQFLSCVRATTKDDLFARFKHKHVLEAFPTKTNWIALGSDSVWFVRRHDKNNQRLSIFAMVRKKKL